uniref:beta-propeller fold lactonase family protein n=1 Tax=unclassified Variovorax TaxID=663243 RepID=UPI0014046730
MAALLSACGGGGGGGGGGIGLLPIVAAPAPAPAAPVARSVGGSVSGLAGKGLVIQNSAAETLAVSADGSFAFADKVAPGQPYAVTVKTQPSDPTQTCTVNRGSGTVGESDVADVAIVCATGSFAVGGSVAGLQGSGLVLQNNAGDDITPTTDGRFFFPARVASGADYAVTVKTQPTSPVQTCSVSQGTGRIGAVDVDNVAVVCATDAFTVSGTVSGLLGIANPVALRNNGGDEILLSADGPFTFPAPVADGAAYAVTVSTQPANPPLVCTVSNASGLIAGAPVTHVAVACSLQSFTVGGSVSGLDGRGLVLQNNTGDDLPIAEDGTFTFPTPVVAGGTYAVSVKTQPKLIDQVCTVIAGSGTVATANVTDVDVSCVSNPARRAFIGTYPSSTDPGFQSWPVDGTGAPVASSVVTTAFPGVRALAISEARKRLYVLDASGYLSVYGVLPDYSLNLVGGLATYTGGTLMALDPLDRSIVIVNPTTGEAEAHLLDGAGIPSAATWTRSLVLTNQTALAFNATGSFLYVANSTNNAIQVVRVLSDGVSLNAPVNFAAGAGPASVGIDISGKYLYTANTNDDTVSRFLIDASTGALSGRIDYASPGAMAIAMHPNGTNLLVAAWSATARVDTFAISAADGTLAAAGSLATTSTRVPMSLTFDPAGRAATLVTQDMLETLSVQPNGTAGKKVAYPQASGVRLSSAIALTR